MNNFIVGDLVKRKSIAYLGRTLKGKVKTIQPDGRITVKCTNSQYCETAPALMWTKIERKSRIGKWHLKKDDECACGNPLYYHAGITEDVNKVDCGMCKRTRFYKEEVCRLEQKSKRSN